MSLAGSPPARRGARVAVAATVLVAALAGCAPAHRPPAAPPPPPARPKPGYEALRDELATPDAHALAGRRIAIDPGHGGFFRGAIGVNGLTEAEVNLGVALDLRGLLEARGAQVLMTRTDDRDFLTPTDSTLRSDLAARVKLANDWHPDLFLSIHHNADAGGAHDVNEIQTYYKLGDEGPSLDAATSVHRYLVRNLGIEQHRILPGNYFVLRNCEAPAILTESSYITDPDVEARLALASKQRLEAEALFLGLARYFARGAPSIVAFAADTVEGSAWRRGAGPTLEARVEGAFDLATLRVDGVARTPARAGSTLAWTPAAPLANGPHEATLRVRLGGHGASRLARCTFTVRRDAARLAVDAVPDTIGRDGGLLGVRVRALDAWGLPIAGPARVRLGAAARVDAPADTVIELAHGEGWGYLRIAPAARHRRGTAASVAARWAGDEAGGAPPGRTAPARAVAEAPFAAPGRPASRTAFLTVTPGDSALTSPPFPPDAGAPWVNHDGFAVFPPDSSGAPIVRTLPGYRPDRTAEGLAVRWIPIAGGALHGRRIVLDPDGGGDDPAGTGPSGTRAASLNLESARILAGMLRAAGAQVLLTREGDLALSDVERVQESEAFGADRFLRIGHRAEPPRIGRFFSSAASQAWAQRTAAALARLGLPAPEPADDAQYPLQQTSCPALYVSTRRVDLQADEDALLAPGALRAEAYALYLGLAREWAGEASWPLDSARVVDAAGAPVAGAIVRLDGALVLETDATGWIRFARTEPGPILARVEDPRVRARALLVESSPGSILTGPGRP